MNVVRIPCTRLSRKIIIREHGAEPIRLNRSHPLWVFIRPHVVGDAVGRSHVLADRDSFFTVTANSSLQKVLRQHANDAGAALHRHHVEMMMRFTWAASLTGSPARVALRAFQELYHLDDDDYDLDTAYRMWQRFKTNLRENFKQKSVNNLGISVLDFCRPADQMPPTEDDLDGIVNFICSRLRVRRPDLPRYVFTQVAIWLHVRHGRRRVDEVAEKFDKSLRRTYVAVERIQGYVDIDDEFAKLVEPDYLFNSKKNERSLCYA